MNVNAHFDQFYAGNENPKQALDLYLPKERNHEAPLPVVVFIHGGGWINGDRLGAAGGAIRMAAWWVTSGTSATAAVL